VFDKDILYAPNLLSTVPENVVSGRTWGVGSRLGGIIGSNSTQAFTALSGFCGLVSCPSLCSLGSSALLLRFSVCKVHFTSSCGG